jgi:hypothetical protein
MSDHMAARIQAAVGREEKIEMDGDSVSKNAPELKQAFLDSCRFKPLPDKGGDDAYRTIEGGADRGEPSASNRYLCERCGGTGTQPAGAYWVNNGGFIRFDEQRCVCCDGCGLLGPYEKPADALKHMAPPNYRLIYLFAGFFGVVAGMAAFAWWRG